MWILDTDHVSLWLQNHPQVVQRIAQVRPDQLAIAIITAEEQVRGRLNVIRRVAQSNQPERSILAYQGLQDTLNDLCKLNILPFTQAAHDCYMFLLQQKIRVGTRDWRIAAIALSRDATVVTRNQRDFGQVPGLRSQDWTID